MPLYEYQCQDCQDTFELRRAFARVNDPAQCPTCRSERTRKLLATVAMVGGGEAMGTTDFSLPMAQTGGCACGGACGCGH